MQRFRQDPKPLGPWHSPGSLEVGHGGPMDWENVSSTFAAGSISVVLAAAAQKGVTFLTVDQTQYDLKKGDVLKGPTVTTVVFVVDSAVAQNATQVNANGPLAGNIPAGTVIRFSADEFITVAAPGAFKDGFSIPIEPLVNALEGGETGTYYGGENFIEITADAPAGTETLSINPLQFPLPDNQILTGSTSGTRAKKSTPVAIVVCRAKSGNGILPRRDAKNGQPAIGFIISEAHEGMPSDSKSGYGIVIGGTSIYENLLPDADPATGKIPDQWKTELIASGCITPFIVWADDRLS